MGRLASGCALEPGGDLEMGFFDTLDSPYRDT